MKNNKKIILTSGSPRRSFLLQEIGIQHEVLKIDFNEAIPKEIDPQNVAQFLAEEKSKQITKKEKGCLYITADTVVILDQMILGKPKDKMAAIDSLEKLSDRSHIVATGVCLSTLEKTVSFQSTSRVYFKKLSSEEINFYIDTYKPYDKAGAYGVQEWIGMIGITKIEGSYFNIMGFPTDLVKIELDKF